jgi:hypothetical protein
MAPVRMATLAAGQCCHQRRMVARSVLADFRPPVTRGCLAGEEQSARQQEQWPGLSAGEWQGKTAHPRWA